MKHTMQFSVGDEVVSVPQDEMDEFNAAAQQRGYSPDPVFSYRVTGKDGATEDVQVPKSQFDEFKAASTERGYTFEPVRNIGFANGTERQFTGPELRKFMSGEYRTSPDYQADRDETAAKVRAKIGDDPQYTDYLKAQDPKSLAESVEGLKESFRGAAYMARKTVLPYVRAFITAPMRLVDTAMSNGGMQMGVPGIVGSPMLKYPEGAGHPLKEGSQKIESSIAPSKEDEAWASENGLSTVGKVEETAQGIGAFAAALHSMGPLAGNILMSATAGNDAYINRYDEQIQLGKSPEEASEAAARDGAIVTLGTAAMGAMPVSRVLKFGKAAPVIDATKGEIRNYGDLLRQAVDGNIKNWLINSGVATVEAAAISGGEAYLAKLSDFKAHGRELDGNAHLEALWDGAKEATETAGIVALMGGMQYGDYRRAIRDGVAREAKAASETTETRLMWGRIFPEGTEAVIRKRLAGENISRGDIHRAGYPEMSQAERNAIGDALVQDVAEFIRRNRQPRPAQIPEKTLSSQPEAAKPVIEAKIDPEGPDFPSKTGVEAPAGGEKPVQPPEVAANPARGASVEGNPTNDTHPAQSAPTPVSVRPTASAPVETTEAAPKNPVEGVSDVVAAKHLTAEGDLKDGDIDAKPGQAITVGGTEFEVTSRDEASGTLTVTDADTGGVYEISENGEVKEVEHGSDQGGSPESAGARAQETPPATQVKGDGEAGTDGNQGRTNGGEETQKGGGTVVGGVKVSKTVADVKPANTKADPKKVAKVAEKFNLHLTKAETEKMSRSKNGINTNLMKTYHDPDGHLVATDGRIIISTTHGFDKAKSDADKASGRSYPNWRKVIPDYDSLSNRSQVNPKAILAVAKEATKLARETGNDPDRVFVRVKVGRNDCLISTSNATKMAEAMDAAGMTELATDARENYPIVAHDGTTDIVTMPFRMSNAWDNDIVIDAQTGRLVHAPKFDRDAKTGRTKEEDDLAIGMEKRAKYRTDIEADIKRSPSYRDILDVRSGKKTAEQAVRDSFGGKAVDDATIKRRTELYQQYSAIKDDSELMNALHDYFRGMKSGFNDAWKRNENDIARLEKHVAAVKRIEELREAEPDKNPTKEDDTSILLKNKPPKDGATDDEIELWQSDTASDLLYVSSDVKTREGYERVLDAFKEIVGKREPKRDSAGLVSGSVERLAWDLLNKPFATDAERKYLWEYTGKPDATAEKYGLEKWQEKKPVEKPTEAATPVEDAATKRVSDAASAASATRKKMDEAYNRLRSDNSKEAEDAYNAAYLENLKAQNEYEKAVLEAKPSIDAADAEYRKEREDKRAELASRYKSANTDEERDAIWKEAVDSGIVDSDAARTADKLKATKEMLEKISSIFSDAAYAKWLHGLKDTPKRRAEYEKSHKAEAPAKEPREKPSAADVIANGKTNLLASPNAKPHKSAKSTNESILYTPTDGTTPFKVTGKSFRHSQMSGNKMDNAEVGKHIGEVLDASVALNEESDNATFRMAAVKIDGNDANVLFTIEKKTGTLERIDVLKTFNTKRSPKVASPDGENAEAAKGFEVSARSIADFERAWQEQFKPGIIQHNKEKGRSNTFTKVEKQNVDSEKKEQSSRSPEEIAEAKPVDAKAVAKRLGTTAYLPTDELRQELGKARRNADRDPRMAARAADIEAVLADREAKRPISRLAAALKSADRNAYGEAMETLKRDIENGVPFPSAKDVDAEAASLPEKQRTEFVKNMDAWRKYAEERAADVRNHVSRLSTSLIDPDFTEWAKRQGVKPDAKQRQMYDRIRNERAVKMLRNFIPNVKVEFADGPTDVNAQIGDVRYLAVDRKGAIKRYKTPSEAIEDFISELNCVEMNDEQIGIYDVVVGNRKSTDIRKDDLDGLVKFHHGSRGKGAFKIVSVHYAGKRGKVSAQEIVDIGQVIRDGELEYDGTTEHPYSHTYTYTADDGAKLKVVVDLDKKGNESVINFYSDRKAGTTVSSANMTDSPHSIANTPPDVNADTEIRASRVRDPELIRSLENGKTVKVFRAMQMIDGKLYPPMAAKVQGKMVDPIELGVWEKADERPDLAKNGKFTLNKANGASIQAAYNPYLHTSRSPLNDQFSSAYKRPNLVTVEVEVPESELTSGYKAEGAKDAVGEMTWHSGPVSSKLPPEKSRRVILSRYDKPIRIVPDSEVADRVAEMLKGEDIPVPSNTVTPSLLNELVKRGVPVDTTPTDIRKLHDRSTVAVVGTYDRRTNRVTLYPGANLETVMHEMGGHALWQYAEQHPELKLKEKLTAYADEAPQELKDAIAADYAGDGLSPEALVDEIFSGRFGREKSGKVADALRREAGRKWYQKVWDAIKGAWRAVVSRFGGNRVDTDALDGMTPDEAVDYMAAQMVAGKTLGRIEPSRGAAASVPSATEGRGTDPRARETGGKFHEMLGRYLEGRGNAAPAGEVRKSVGGEPAGDDASELLALARENGGELGPVERARGALSREPWPDGETEKSGMETISVVRDGGSVVKFRKADNTTDHEYEKVADHNELFPDTKYTVRGFASDRDGKPVTVLEQRYVEFEPNSGEQARKMLLDELRERFGSAEMRGNEIHAGGWAIDDLKDANIGIDTKTGKPAVIDCIIHRVDELPQKLRWESDRADGGEVRYARGGSPSPAPAAKPVDIDKPLTFIETWKKKFKDSNVALQSLDKQLGYADKSGEITDENKSIWMARTLQPGRVQAGLDRRDMYERDIGKLMKDSGITRNDIDDYLLSQAVPERNARLAKSKAVNDGSGLSDADAAKLLSDLQSRLSPEQMKAVRDAADLAWQMQAEGQRMRIDSGRLDQATYDAWQNDEPHHVPMRDDYSDVDGEWTRRSNGYKKREFATAEGRTTRSDSPLVFMFREFSEAVTGSEDNLVRQKIAEAVRQHKELGKVHSASRGEGGVVVLNGNAGPGVQIRTVRENRRFGDGGDPNILLFKENGELRAIEMNGEVGERVAAAMLNRDVADFGTTIMPKAKIPGTDVRIADVIKGGSRFWANTATAWSPTFGVGNLVKDKIENDIHGIADFGIVGGLKNAVKGYKTIPAEAKPIFDYIRTRKFDTSTERGRLIKRFVEAGGQIGGGAASEGYSEIEKTFDGFSKMSDSNKVKTIFRASYDFLKRYNESMELLNRINNFKNATDGGMSDRAAALKSRLDSTDFNQFGDYKWMNTIWNFSNSVTGGTVRQATKLLGKNGKRLAVFLMGLGFAEGMAEVLMNGDDDEREKRGEPTGKDMTEYDRINSLYVRVWGRKYSLPIHAGWYSTLKYVGNGLARVITGNLSGETYAANLYDEVVATLKHYTGTGDVSGGSEDELPIAKQLRLPDVAQSFSPSVLQPLVQIKENKTYRGTPLRPKVYDESKPLAYNGRRNTPEVYKAVAQWSNDLFGGNKSKKSSGDMSPENLRALFEGVTKNLGKDAVNTADLVTRLVSGKGIEPNTLPFGSRFVRDIPENDTRYYEALRQYDADRKEYAEADGKRKSEIFREKRYVAGDGLRSIIKRIEFYKRWEEGRLHATEYDKKDGHFILKKASRNVTVSDEKKAELQERRRKLQAQFLRAVEKKPQNK